MLLQNLVSLVTVYLLVAAWASVHVLLNKRDSRATLGWLGLIVLFPIAGAVLYALFGINRVQRKARRIALRIDPGNHRGPPAVPAAQGSSLRRIGQSLTCNELVIGNSVRILRDGEQAYPEMLAAIAQARSEILLSTYIFDHDATGLEFVAALAEAHGRGVRVNVLVDDFGIRYSFPTIIRALRRANLPFRRFMPLRLLPPSLSINMRTHRKLLVVDRQLCFAGGMNIGDRQRVTSNSRHRASDLHFSFEGLIVGDFVEMFADDWRYSGGEELDELLPRWLTPGSASCRLVADGPDNTLDLLKLLIMGTITAAQRRVWIMTPYFLPDRMMVGCLQAAALSGVDIQVMIPERNNWPVVQWALQHNLRELLDAGVNVLQRPAPFAHSKCIVVDDDYALVGSANLDPRSLRLNFELGVEVFDAGFNRELSAHFAELSRRCACYTLRQLESRSTLVRLRDSASALFSPYL